MTDSGSVADWASAVGSIGAVVVALWLAGRDSRRSAREDKLQRVSLAFATADLMRKIGLDAFKTAKVIVDENIDVGEKAYQAFLRSRDNARDVVLTLTQTNLVDADLLVLLAEARRTVIEDFQSSPMPMARVQDLSDYGFAMMDFAKRMLAYINKFGGVKKTLDMSDVPAEPPRFIANPG